MHSADLSSFVSDFLATERLPSTFEETIQHWYLPLAKQLLPKVKAGQLSVLGISGCQGSGKSTLTNFLQQLFNDHCAISTVGMSLDDFYLSHSHRQALAREVHPLLATRGVPGTHDIQLALHTLNDLLTTESQVAVPRFDKAADDRKPIDEWDSIQAPIDLIILEGWCLNVPAQSASELITPINQLERDEDADGHWRQYVNQQLRDSYPALFNCVDTLIMIKAPEFDCVYQWRGRQEEKLAAATGANVSSVQNNTQSKIMDQQALQRFIQHYERLTRHSLKTLPQTADIVFELDSAQNIVRRVDTEKQRALNG